MADYWIQRACLAFVMQLARDNGGFHPDTRGKDYSPALTKQEVEVYDTVLDFLNERMIDVADYAVSAKTFFVMVVDGEEMDCFPVGQPTLSFVHAVTAANKEANKLQERHPELIHMTVYEDIAQHLYSISLESDSSQEGNDGPSYMLSVSWFEPPIAC